MNLIRLLAATSFMTLALLSSISPILADNPPVKTGADVKDRQEFEVNGVKVENFTGNVTVKSTQDAKTVRVSLKGDDKFLKQILVTDAYEAEKGKLYIAFAKDVPILVNIDKLILTLEVPAKMPLDLTLVGGKGKIGERETDETKVNINGSGDIELESVKNLESEIDGSGEMTIMKIEGDAAISIRGDGKYTIQKGAISNLKASIEGTGIMNINADVKDADLKSDGAGTMELATVTGKLKQSMNGSGTIRISKIEGSFTNKASGSTRLEMNCGKK
jgi:hypothetical protein